MSWRVLIGEGSKQVVLTEPAGDIPGGMSFAWTRVAALRPDGQTEYVDTTINIAGDLEPTPTQTLEDAAAILANLVDLGGVVRVQLQRDSGSGFVTVPGGDFVPAAHIGTPKVTEVEMLNDEGSGESHWPYRVRIYARKPGVGSGGSPQTTTNVSRSIRVERYKKTIIRKIWSIDVQAKTLTDAVQYGRARKPSATPLIEVEERQADNNRYVATWTWEPAAGTVIDIIEEIPNVVRVGPRFVIRTLAGDRKPLFHEAKQQPRRATFNVRIRAIGDGDQPPTLPAIPFHLAADGVDIIDVSDELPQQIGEPICVDKQNGIWEFVCPEQFLVSPDAVLNVNHDTHNKPLAATQAKEPPDGNFFN